MTSPPRPNLKEILATVAMLRMNPTLSRLEMTEIASQLQWRERCQCLWAENARLRGNGAELAAAAEQLLGTSVTERNEPSVWFPRVDALKLAIAVMRGRIVHGSASSSTEGNELTCATNL